MNTFLLPLGAVLVLLFFARRFVRHRETLHEHHDRLRKSRDGGFRDIEHHNAAMDAAEALAPLRLALRERLDQLEGLEAESTAITPEAAAPTPRARLVARGHSLCVRVQGMQGPSGEEGLAFTVRWEQRESHFSSLQRGREVMRGTFVLVQPGHEDERHNDLDTLERRCGALLLTALGKQAAPRV